jgi:hypothetical protein
MGWRLPACAQSILRKVIGVIFRRIGAGRILMLCLFNLGLIIVPNTTAP